jgi:hypothetical protein
MTWGAIAMKGMKMKGVPILLTFMVLLFAGCARTLNSDVASTVQVAVAATLTAQPTETPMETPTRTPTPKATPIRALPPTKTPAPFTLSLKTFSGQGFSFQYPANARLENVTPSRKAWQVTFPVVDQLYVIGPQVWIKPGDADWSYFGPAYNLTIRTYENHEELDPESWARDYILTAWQEARERNRPWGALPVSEEGEIDEDVVGNRVVAGQPAFWVRYFAFDSVIFAYYLSIHHQVVELSFRLYPLENQPLAVVQQDVYALILGTLSLEGR